MPVELAIILGIISALGVFSSITFAYLAFNRSSKSDNKNAAVDITTIKLNGEYTKKGVERIEVRLDGIESQQSLTAERLTRLEARVDILEHLPNHTI